ncbi:MAG: hypothetical protein KAT39_04160, partial [Alphaproteobacteria bacterium]|nr:hypothetical protein [Alphaproteobacteria bacterium]
MNRTIVIGIAGIVFVLIALGLNFWLLGEDEPDQPVVATTPVTVTPTPEPQPAPTPAPEPAST